MPSEEDNLIEQIKLNMPGFTLTKNALLHPTSDGVKRFYRKFLVEYHEQIALASGVTDGKIPGMPGDTEEEVLFKEISKIVSNNHIKFMLRDIYQPTHVRTVKFFMVCNHILIFAKSISEQIKQLNDNIIDLKNQADYYQKEHEDVLNQVSDNAKQIALKQETIAMLQIEQKEKRIVLEQAEEKKRKAQQTCQNTRRRIEEMKSRMSGDQLEIKRLEELQKKLQLMCVSENILENKLKALEEQEKEFPDLLSVEDSELENHRRCKRKIPEPESFGEKATSLILLKDDLKNVSEEVENLKKQLDLVQMQLDCENNTLVGGCTKCKSLKKECETIMKLCYQSEQNLLRSIEKVQRNMTAKERDLQSSIARLEEEIIAIETDIKNMLQSCKEASEKINMAEKHVCTKFYGILVKISRRLTEKTEASRSS
nr:unnamed protein product [Callosobruchus analis]